MQFMDYLCNYIFSRRLCKVEATVVRENEKKVNVEDTFPPKSSPGGENGGPDSEPPNGPLEKWVIKLEQSINIFLTVYFLILSNHSLYIMLGSTCSCNARIIFFSRIRIQ